MGIKEWLKNVFHHQRQVRHSIKGIKVMGKIFCPRCNSPFCYPLPWNPRRDVKGRWYYCKNCMNRFGIVRFKATFLNLYSLN